MDLLLDRDYVQQFNTKIPTNRIIQFLRDMDYEDFFHNQTGLWSGSYDVPLSSIITKHGLCFNFNLEKATDLFNLEK